MNDNYILGYSLSAGLALLILLLAIAPAVSVSGLVLRKTTRSLNFRIWLNTILVGLITVLAIARLVILIMMGGNGLELIPVNFAVSFLFTLAPLLATLGLTIPRLWKLRQPRETAGPAPLSDPVREAAAAAGLVVPVQSLLVGAVLSGVITTAADSGVLTLVAAAAWLVFSGWAWFRQTRFRQKLAQNGPAAIPRFVRRLGGRLATVLAFGAGFLVIFLVGINTTRLPDHYNMTMDETHSTGMVMAPGQKMLSVTDLTGQQDGTPDKTFTLTAEQAQVKLDNGQTVDAWTYNGQLPGPELRVNQGDLVQVTLQNKDVTEGVTLHWHGVDVPNAEDGVAGLTQDAVMPGQTFVYRFRVNEAGTYWYHSHQFSNEQVRMGLFGAFIVEPKTPTPANTTDLTVLAHTWTTTAGSNLAFGLATATDRKAVAPGSPVRLRLINANNKPLNYSLTGTPFRVTAIDGTDLNQPGLLTDIKLPLAAGGRYDLEFTMPDHPVLLNSGSVNVLLSPDGKGDMTPSGTKVVFNPATYGQPASEQPVTLQSHFDHQYTFDLDNGLGFYNGSLASLWLINDQVFPNTPSINVNEGDLIKITFVNRSPADHPMHPHGHKMLVLSRNGQPVSGSPWWTDTLNVGPGEIITVALKADNPGLWMDHCHNLDHAASGMVMHLMYNNVMTPFQVGPASGNDPE
jgi:FtsP/CotA-like multicopper oxidase with cupredoxin domain